MHKLTCIMDCLVLDSLLFLSPWPYLFCIQGPLKNRKLSLIFICIPVSPGRSRLIWTFPRNFGVAIDKIVPRWVFHIGQNKILDSDLHLLHVEERKILERGPENWQKACFIPTKSDALVVTFRRWFNKYSGAQVDWRGKFDPSLLPPTPPREQLFDRFTLLTSSYLYPL